YVVRPGDTYYDNPRLPLTFYVSTSYADGTPAQCTVTIAQQDGESDRVLARTRTNQYGIGVIEQLRPASTELKGTDLTLNFSAQDKAGSIGHHDETYELRDSPVIRVSTNKALLAAGEPIAVSITSTEEEGVLTIDVVRDWLVLQSQTLRLHHGSASLVLPYRPEYKDQVTVAA